MNEITYIAQVGDVVLLASGQTATVVNANAVSGGRSDSDRFGAYYSLLFNGGWEDTYYVWADAPTTMVRATPRNDAGVQPIFTVIDVAQLVSASGSSSS